MGLQEKLKKNLIRLSVSGYGENGPYVYLNGYDRQRFMSLNFFVSGKLCVISIVHKYSYCTIG